MFGKTFSGILYILYFEFKRFLNGAFCVLIKFVSVLHAIYLGLK